jgi:hypothetical protein
MTELESMLLACGFNEADANIIVGEFLSGIGNVMEAKGAAADQKVGEVLTEEQAAEILTKALGDRLAAIPESERSKIDLEMLEQKFSYR